MNFMPSVVTLHIKITDPRTSTTAVNPAMSQRSATIAKIGMETIVYPMIRFCVLLITFPPSHIFLELVQPFHYLPSNEIALPPLPWLWKSRTRIPLDRPPRMPESPEQPRHRNPGAGSRCFPNQAGVDRYSSSALSARQAGAGQAGWGFEAGEVEGGVGVVNSDIFCSVDTHSYAVQFSIGLHGFS